MNGIIMGILAGGKSSRMGQDKAHLPWGEKTFLEHLVEETSGFDEVLISVDSVAHWSDSPYQLVVDELNEFGPAEGIYQLLKKAASPYVFVIAADMPNLTADFLTSFAAQVRHGDCCMPAYANGRIQPLCCVYHKTALPFLKKMRTEKEHRISALFSMVQTRCIMPELLGYDADIVRNVNTMAEYTAWMQDFAEKEQYNL